MRFRTNLIIFVYMPVMFLTGCSTFNNSTKQSKNNVAYFTASEVLPKSVSERKKPIKPAPEPEIIDTNKLNKSSDIKIYKYDDLDSIYIVRSGDTIYGISRKYGIKPEEIMTSNGLNKESKLLIGQKLKIENCIAKEIIYVICSGDSLSTIAGKYGVSIKSLKAANNLSSDMIVIGKKLSIPQTGKEKQALLHNSQSSFTAHLDSDGKYTVKNGDSLSLISWKLGIQQKDLQNANGIYDPDKLRVEQRLIIPNKSAASTNQSNIINQNITEIAENPNNAVITPANTNAHNVIKPNAEDDFFDNFEQISVIEAATD